MFAQDFHDHLDLELLSERVWHFHPDAFHTSMKIERDRERFSQCINLVSKLDSFCGKWYIEGMLYKRIHRCAFSNGSLIANYEINGDEDLRTWSGFLLFCAVCYVNICTYSYSECFH